MNRVITQMGSYPEQDVTFLLKDLSSLDIEQGIVEREHVVQNGGHYSEMLPIEYKPTEEYMSLFYQSLKESKHKVAVAVGVVAEQIIKHRGYQTVLCSLARAGTPIGVLIKRYIKFKYKKDLPHYSISIIRDKGIDSQALHYILEEHPEYSIMFIDGWTGKGTITKELANSIQQFNKDYHTLLSDELAVLADPGCCSRLYGTREDFLIPSACLNSTISGLVSRTVLNEKWIGPQDFHGAKFYSDLIDEDVSNYYVDTITFEFGQISDEVNQTLLTLNRTYEEPRWEGLHSIEKIKVDFNIDDINLIKPGVGETTRVLLRRVPWKILVKPGHLNRLKHIKLLADDRDVPIIEYEKMAYDCCGLIKPMEDLP